MRTNAKETWGGWRNSILTAAAFVACLLLPGLPAQSPPAPAPPDRSASALQNRPKFEVASVKRNKPNASGPQYSLEQMQPGGRVVIVAVQLRGLIGWAYQLKPGQVRLISGIPAWANSESFDIQAQAGGDTSSEQMFLMLQSLLADRFKLALHTETRRVPVYALVFARTGKMGPQLRPHSDSAECLKLAPGQPVPKSDFGVTPPPPPACGQFISGARRLAGNNVTMEMLAASLGGMPVVDRPVVNRTGPDGTFDLTLNFSPVDADTSDPSAPPSIFTALQEQLGLKLESTTGVMPVTVVDHAEQPSGN